MPNRAPFVCARKGKPHRHPTNCQKPKVKPGLKRTLRRRRKGCFSTSGAELRRRAACPSPQPGALDDGVVEVLVALAEVIEAIV